ncbi:MAG: hypothetical protein ACKVOO_12400 [Burkholderiaceae bacterium]
MAALVKNHTIEQGATWVYEFELHAEAVDGPLIDLTGWHADMQVRQAIEAAAVEIELSTDNGRITITPAAGQVRLALSASETATLNFETAVYDLELVGPTGFVLRLYKGEITLDKESTRKVRP